jgi:hypothetical protein
MKLKLASNLAVETMHVARDKIKKPMGIVAVSGYILKLIKKR